MKTDQIMEYACDNLCRFPAEYKDPDDLWNEQCDHCKLMELLGEQRNTIKSYERTIRKLVDAITQSVDRKK